ncbi:hypothetical protein ACFSQ7_07345 [Paenibacillus rhizoplanae]
MAAVPDPHLERRLCSSCCYRQKDYRRHHTDNLPVLLAAVQRNAATHAVQVAAVRQYALQRPLISKRLYYNKNPIPPAIQAAAESGF